MHKAILACFAVAFLTMPLHTASAQAGAWCSQVNTGAGRIEENCGFASEETCRRTVLAGNRGFCIRNPAYRIPASQRRRIR